MNRLAKFYRSTVGQKVVMAVTGIILIGFLISHVLANLLVFTGPDALREYALLLRRRPEFLWIARGGLLVAALLHVWSAWKLTRVDRAARPVGYTRWTPQASTIASRTIRWGGLLILVFIVYHIFHFTTGHVHPTFVHLDPYGNIVRAFRNWWVSAFYVIAMAAVGLHLFHGAWSSMRTLGLAPSGNPFRRRVTIVLAVLIWLGFTSIPLAVLAGIVK